VPSAKSMQPKPQLSEITNPNEQQIASSNRDMRRRYAKHGHRTLRRAAAECAKDARPNVKSALSGASNAWTSNAPSYAKSLPGGVTIGRRNTYFLIAVVAWLSC